MGTLLPKYKASMIEDMVTSIAANSAYYYMFQANPTAYPSTPPTITEDDYAKAFLPIWTMIQGKKIRSSDVVPMIRYIRWTSNTTYYRYDNTSANLANVDFYVVTDPEVPGGYYHVYKCLDNANGAVCTEKPDQQQLNSFTKSDDYKWRYIYSVSNANWNRFASEGYCPVYGNAVVQAAAFSYSGIDLVPVVNGGDSYSVYTDGAVRFANTTCIQLDSADAAALNHYKDSACYIYNTGDSAGQLRKVANSTGSFVYFSEEINTAPISVGTTLYKITPFVQFNTDGDDDPIAYCTINAVGNSINSVVIVDPGFGITRATAQIVSNTSFGSGANVYVVVPPIGGHGYQPAHELYCNAIGISISFANSESNNLKVDIPYNKIGIIKNPYTLNANNTKGVVYTANYFTQILQANVTTPITFEVGANVVGNTTNATGTVVFSNSTIVWISGDKDFSNGEYITDGSNSAIIDINTLGDLYPRDIVPLYSQNINNVNRSSNTSETYKIVIEL